MIVGGLADALRRLDALLVRVCDAEERRARRMYTEDRGWASLRASLGPPASELAFDAAVPELPLAGPGAPPALTRLCDAAGLTSLEADVLLVLLAPYLEPRYGKLYTVLQDDAATPHVTERLLFTLLGRSPARAAELAAALADDGRLCGPALVVRAIGWYAARARPIELAPEVRDALLGLPRPGVVAEHELEWRDSADEPAASPVLAPPPLQVVWGPGDCDAAAGAVSGGAELAVVRPGAPLAAGALEALWRAAVLHGAALVIDLTRLGGDEAARLADAVRRLIGRHGGAAVLESAEPLGIAAVHHHAPLPAFAARRAEWAATARAHGAELGADELERLAGNHPLTGRRLAEVFRAVASPDAAALNEAAHRLRRTPVRHARPAAAGRTFDDLVLRASTRDALERLIYYVGRRDAVSERDGLEARFRIRRGPVVLFAGRSGTGKTLAAEVVAGAVGRPLAVVDLSRLVSKYIGETEKHIDEILRAAERSGTVLLFDEADALFSSRTEVSTSNDRYANLEVGYLLQRIEQHDGLVILATNLRHTIDEAFLRRFHARVEFPFPDPDERRAIWSLMLGPALDARDLARHRLAGGDIRNASLKAIFLAEREGAPLAMRHVERAVALELFELGRLSRRDVAADDAGRLLREVADDAGRLLREVIEGLELQLEAALSHRFLKEIHFVHGAPTKEAMAGRRPAVSVAVFRMVSDGDGVLRMGLVVSTWSSRPEEEIELLGVLQELFTQLALPPVGGRQPVTHVQRSFDFDLLHRFWSSHGHPMRPSLLVDVELRPS